MSLPFTHLFSKPPSPPPHEYDDYIDSPEWRKRRRRALQLWKGRCAVTLAKADAVHHLHYDWCGVLFWQIGGWQQEEGWWDVLPLCDEFHMGVIHQSALTTIIWETGLGRRLFNLLLRCWALVTLALVRLW